MQRFNLFQSLFTTVALLCGGCALSTAQDVPDDSSDPQSERGGMPTGKADGEGLPGSCGDLESGVSPDGCYCDDECCDYFDCCEDRAYLCKTGSSEGEEGAPAKATYEMYGRYWKGNTLVHCHVILTENERGFFEFPIEARHTVELFDEQNDLSSLTWQDVQLEPAWTATATDEHGLRYFFWSKTSWLGELDPFAKKWSCVRPDVEYLWVR